MLGNNQGIAVAQKNTALSLAVPGRKSDILHNDGIGLYAKALALVSSAERAFITRASHGYLQQYAVGFTGGPYDIPFIVHVFDCPVDIRTD